jgi:hypothetical protein
MLASRTTLRPIPPAELTPPHPPTRVWLRLHNNDSILAVDSAAVQHGTLDGVVDGSRREFSLSDVSQLEVRRLSKQRTYALIVIGVAGVMTASYFLTRSESCDHPDCGFISNDTLTL